MKPTKEVIRERAKYNDSYLAYRTAIEGLDERPSLVSTISDRLLLFLQGVLCGALIMVLASSIGEVSRQSVNRSETQAKECGK